MFYQSICFDLFLNPTVQKMPLKSQGLHHVGYLDKDQQHQ